MPNPDEYSPLPAPAPVTPPTLPPDFQDIPQNPSSELHPPPDATPDMVAGTTPEPVSSEDHDRDDAPGALRQLEQ
jgi:hypothetical protein